ATGMCRTLARADQRPLAAAGTDAADRPLRPDALPGTTVPADAGGNRARVAQLPAGRFPAVAAPFPAQSALAGGEPLVHTRGVARSPTRRARSAQLTEARSGSSM